MIRVTGLHVYPVKSCRGIALNKAEIRKMGICFDRQWMVVDDHNLCVSQLKVRSMGRIETAFEGDNLVLTAPDMERLVLPKEGAKRGKQRRVHMGKIDYETIDQGSNAMGWFSEYLSREAMGRYRLVRIEERKARKTKQGGGSLAFVYSYPCSVISEESLDALNTLLTKPIPMNRFRPNIVIRGEGAAYKENHYTSVKIRNIQLRKGAPIERCKMITINQETGEINEEPLKVLMRHQRNILGVNMIHEGNGVIAVGDQFKV